ncbi:hypothetical protein Leryth_006809 [Lithospermum erythrorhizon]|nr:hypothetical protein Leryth_006809 [Lithospermum erythrorhizon]
MALVKNRGNKRSSGSSGYSSTVTTAVFVALCIMGVYMLSPHSISHATTATTSTATKTLAHLTTIADSSRRKPIEDEERHTFNDNEGNLPEDAIKSDDPDQPGTAGMDSNNDDDNKGKQKDLETQTSEESVVSQNQEVEELTNNDNANEDSSGQGSNEMNDQHRQSEKETEGVTSEDQMQHDDTTEKTYEDTTKNLEEENLHGNGKNSQKTSSQLSGGKQQSYQENKGDSSSQTGGTVIPKESNESKKKWSTQEGQSENQKDKRKGSNNQDASADTSNWKLCNVTAGQDYIPCLDNEAAIARLRSRNHFQHRERHCPDQGPTCLVPLPPGYKTSVKWPQSRDKIWYRNVPQTTLAEVKGHQNWVKVTGEFLTFPGGGTQFIHGASHYIDFIQEALPEIAWGKHTRVILDVGCGVASFGGFLFDKDVLAISFAPKDEHTAQVQFALERGIPAISAVMGTQRLPFPSKVFDLVHCARCRVPWHAEGGALLLELNRVLRPGEFMCTFSILDMSALTKAICWKLVTIKKDALNKIGAAIYKKPNSNECYEQRKSKAPPMCKTNDDPNAAWFAAVLKDMKLWVMNMVNIDAPDTLPIIYERGLFGIYHDWCESFSTYPRTYDLLHADHLFSSLKKRCQIDPLIVEIDRVLRPGGKLIVRDESSIIDEVEKFLRSLHWEIRMTFSKNQEGMLSAEKTTWRPNSYASSS